MSLLKLPVELQALILRNLDHRDILRCSLVCRHLRNLVTSSIELQYQVELGCDGLIDVPYSTSGLSTSERLQRVLARRAAWRTLSLRERTIVCVPGTCLAYELVGGVFAKVLESNGFNAAWLPSSTRAETQMNVPDLGVAVKDFAIDPTQDLIALLQQTRASHDAPGDSVEVRVLLRTLSSGVSATHPEAKFAVLRKWVPIIRGCMIQIVDDVVGLYHWLPARGALIWNWKTGETLVHFDEDRAPTDIWDFSFLSSRSYAITTLRGGGTIQIYAFGGVCAPGETGSAHITTLYLPPASPSSHLTELTTTTGPFTNVPTHVPFATASTSRVHTFSVHYQFNESPIVCYVVHNRTLTAYVDRHIEGDPPESVPWEDWGLKGSRAFTIGFAPRWHRYVCGERFVCPLVDATGETRFHLINFNVHPLREAADQPGLVTEPSELRSDDIAAGSVVTGLPYHSKVIPDRGGPYIGFMIDDERLLGLVEGPFFDDLGLIDVYTF